MAISDNLAEQVRSCLLYGIESLGLTLSKQAIWQLLQYLLLLHKWNQRYNLTSIRDLKDMVSRHVLDSLSILPFIDGRTLLDVGTGAGLPGIPIAIAQPELTVTLIEANGKRVRFLRQVLLELMLPQVVVYQQRIENLDISRRFDCITARAFADLSQLVSLAMPFLENNGRILAMKGCGSVIEREMKGMNFASSHIITIQVPFIEYEQRHVVVIRKP